MPSVTIGILIFFLRIYGKENKTIIYYYIIYLVFGFIIMIDSQLSYACLDLLRVFIILAQFSFFF